MKKKRAFSLIELIIVIAVMGVLAAILIPVIGSMIKKANAKSALSDARNALTSYEDYVYTTGSYNADSVFIVYKSGGLYVYGYLAVSGRLYEAAGNPYKTDEDFNSVSEELFNKLLEIGDIAPCEGQLQANISEEPKNIPETVAVYSGYKIVNFSAKISFTKNDVEIAKDESVQLKAVVSPEAPIEYTVDDAEIATVDENGVVTGHSVGTAVVTATCGGNTSTCTVHVIDYIEFYGTVEQLKQYFENTGTTTTFIRLMCNIPICDDVSILPIKLPQDKHVRIDFNGKGINFVQELDNEEPVPECAIENNGGVLELFSDDTNPSYFGNISLSFNGENRDPQISHYATINNKKGECHINNRMWVTGTDYAIVNSGRLFMNTRPSDYGILSDAIYNAVGGHAEIINTDLTGALWDGNILINDGVIESMKNCKADGFIINNGTIIKMQDCKVITTSRTEDDNSTLVNATVLKSSGVINELKNCEFVLKEMDGNSIVGLGIAAEFSDGEIRSIENCTFIGTEDAIVYTGGFELSQKLKDGKYSHQVPSEMIADGYECMENEDNLFVINKK